MNLVRGGAVHTQLGADHFEAVFVLPPPFSLFLPYPLSLSLFLQGISFLGTLHRNLLRVSYTLKILKKINNA